MSIHVQKPLLSRQEVAETLGISIRTVDVMLERKQLESIKVNRFVRIKAESLEQFMQLGNALPKASMEDIVTVLQAQAEAQAEGGAK
jgi:excisionase family DNA binding protein